MRKIFIFIFFAIISSNFVVAKEIETTPENTIDGDFIIHYKRFVFESFDTFQFASLADNPPKVALTNRELYKTVLTVEGNEKLVKKSKFWKGVGYFCLGSFVGTGIGCYSSPKGSDAEIYTGACCLISLLLIPIVNQMSVSYKMQAIDNYNMSLVHEKFD